MREMKNSFVAWIGEIPSTWQLFRFKDNYKKLILLGHSQGGLIASYLAGIYNPYKLILLSPAYNLIDLVKSKTFFGKKIKEGMDLHIWNMTFTASTI